MILPSAAAGPISTHPEATIPLTPRIGSYDHLLGVLGCRAHASSSTATSSARTAGRAYPIIEEVRQRLGDRLVFVFRHFPLAELHPFALSAAVAAEGAALKGQFWPMHDKLYSGDEPRLRRRTCAATPRRSASRRRRCSGRPPGSSRTGSRPTSTPASAAACAARPTLFVNGEIYRGSISVEHLVEALETTAPAPVGPML